MSALAVRDGDKVTQMTREALLEGVRRGGVSANALVQEVQGGAWARAGNYFLAQSTIDPPRDPEGERFLKRNVATGLDQESLLDLLGVDRAAIQVRVRHEPPPEPRPIEIPQVDEGAWGRDYVVDRIGEPDWDPDPDGVVAQRITVPRWGAHWVLPTVKQIPIPAWTDPAEKLQPLGPAQHIVWRRQATVDVPAPPRAKRAATTRGAARAQRAQPAARSPGPAVQAPPSAEPPSRRHRPQSEVRGRSQRESQGPQQTTARSDGGRKQEVMRQFALSGVEPKAARSEVSAEVTVEPGAVSQAAAAVTVVKGVGLFGCLGQLIGLGALLFGVALGVDVALTELSNVELPSALAHPERAAAPSPDKALQPFVASGPREAWLQVVIAADLTRAPDALSAARLLAALDAAAEEGKLPGDGDMRLIFLPRVGAAEDSTPMALALLALARQDAFWPWLRPALSAGRPLGLQDVLDRLDDLGVDRTAFDRDRASAETGLQVRTWSTMAAALGLDDAIAALNGHPLGHDAALNAENLAGAVEAAVAAASEVQRLGGDAATGLEKLAASLPGRMRDRYVRWILRGERIAGRIAPEQEPAAAPEESGSSDAGRGEDKAGGAAVARDARVEIRPPRHAPTLGPADAPVTITVFIDFHCPYCKRHAANLARLRQTFGDKLRVVVLQYPIDALHPSASEAAAVALAASRLGLFEDAWQLLFEWGGQGFDRATILAEIERLGAARGVALRRGQLARETVRARRLVARDLRLKKKLGVSGTPFSWVNGRPVRGAVPYEKLRDLVQQELQRAGGEGPSGPDNGTPAEAPEDD